jgi:tetratricopeptide (TPR) repeat protein
MEGSNFLKEAQDLIKKEEYSKAQSLLLKYAFSPGQSSQDYFEWGKLAEELQLYEEAIRLYNKAYQFNPDNSQILLALAQIYYQLKNYYQTFKILRKLLSINPTPEIQSFFIDIAKKLKFYGILKHWEKPKTPSHNSFLSTLLNYDIFPVYEHFRYLFRDITYFSELSLDPYGNPHLKPETEKLTLTKFKEHLLGRTHLVFFPIKENLQFSHFFLGIKLSEKLIQKCLNLESFFITKKEEIFHIILSIYRNILNLGFPAYLEKFHCFYYRIWFFLEREVPLGTIKAFLKNLIQKISPLTGGLVFIEGVPQVSLLEKSNLRYTSVPLGLYLFTLERSQFLTEDGIPPEDQLSFFKKITPFKENLLSEFISTLHFKPKTVSYSAEVEILRKKCHLLDYVIKKAEAGKQLTREEKLSLVLTIGFLERGKEVLHQILSQTPDYTYTKIENLLKNLPPHPVSCLKLELWLKEISVFEPCRCIFGEKLKDRYPSPLLHIKKELVPAYTEIAYKIRSIKDLVKQYLKQKEKLDYFEILIKNYLKTQGLSTLKIENFLIELKGNTLCIKEK